jgi:hypothetical protein
MAQLTGASLKLMQLKGALLEPFLRTVSVPTKSIRQ